MIYYKDDNTGEVYAYYQSDVEQDLIKEGLREMTFAEVEAHLNPIPTYWTDGSALILCVFGGEGWWKATETEIEALLPLMQAKDVERKVMECRVLADTAIAPLQDAVDLGEATEAEAAALLAWKRYRVALNRLPDQPGYPGDIAWPDMPA